MDFYELSNYYGHPPKIIWLRFGNKSTNDLAQLIIDKFETVKEFILSDKYKDIACIELD